MAAVKIKRSITLSIDVRLIVCRKHNSLGVSMKTETQQTNTSMLGCFACLTANTPYCQQKCIVSPLFFVLSPSSVQLSRGFVSYFTNHKRKTQRRTKWVRNVSSCPFQNTGEVSQKQGRGKKVANLCDKRDNNFHLSLTKNRLYLHHVCHKEAFCRPLLSAVVFSSLCRNMS